MSKITIEIVSPNGTMGGVFINPEGGASPQAIRRASFFYFTTKEVFRWLTIKRISPTLGKALLLCRI